MLDRTDGIFNPYAIIVTMIKGQSYNSEKDLHTYLVVEAVDRKNKLLITDFNDANNSPQGYDSISCLKYDFPQFALNIFWINMLDRKFVL